jgi:hypothetical protein
MVVQAAQLVPIPRHSDTVTSVDHGDATTRQANRQVQDRGAAAARQSYDAGCATGTPHAASAVAESLLVDSVRSVLARLGQHDWRVMPDGVWCHVQPADSQSRAQGWKLHVSATPLSAPHVLARSAEVLVRSRCPFKFAGTIDRVRDLCSRHVDRSAGGKFLTAYPEDDGHFRAIAEELHHVTEGLPGPGILSDRPYGPGSLVHYRFGAFASVPVLGNDGVYEPCSSPPTAPWYPTSAGPGSPRRAGLRRIP